jgi:hypothetical protein
VKVFLPKPNSVIGFRLWKNADWIRSLAHWCFPTRPARRTRPYRQHRATINPFLRRFQQRTPIRQKSLKNASNQWPHLAIPSLECYIALEQHQPNAIVMRRTDRGFLRESVAEIETRIELPMITSSLPMCEIYDGVEFTPECVQEADEAYSS